MNYTRQTQKALRLLPSGLQLRDRIQLTLLILRKLWVSSAYEESIARRKRYQKALYDAYEFPLEMGTGSLADPDLKEFAEHHRDRMRAKMRRHMLRQNRHWDARLYASR